MSRAVRDNKRYSLLSEVASCMGRQSVFISSLSAIKSLLERLYYEVLWARSWVGAKLSDSIEASVGSVTASFGVPTTQEYFWVRNLENEEAVVIEDLIEEVTDGDVFWDVGANIGLFSCFIGHAADVSLVAFEPYPPNVRKLRSNLDRNTLSDRATIVERALGAETGRTPLTVSNAWDTMHSLGDEGTETITVEVVRGDEIVTVVDPPDVVKIDVEGAELDVLDGMETLLSSCRAIYCEVHDARGVPKQAVRDRLETAGFEVVERTGDENTTNLLARR